MLFVYLFKYFQTMDIHFGGFRCYYWCIFRNDI